MFRKRSSFPENLLPYLHNTEVVVFLQPKFRPAHRKIKPLDAQQVPPRRQASNRSTAKRGVGAIDRPPVRAQGHSVGARSSWSARNRGAGPSAARGAGWRLPATPKRRLRLGTHKGIDCASPLDRPARTFLGQLGRRWGTLASFPKRYAVESRNSRSAIPLRISTHWPMSSTL
jgi:hypothetical protein